MSSIFFNKIIAQVPAAQVAESSGSVVHAVIFWVIVALAVFLFFYFLKRTDAIVEQRKQAKQDVNKIVSEPKKQFDYIPEETAAAIALAISRYKVQFEEMENLRLTINKVSKQYSPWSSKIYSMRQLPR
jgi:glutaconyl-CoA/methylmalonyl-CoA decarboxylase subunit delta